jgi:hypothetical protein
VEKVCRSAFRPQPGRGRGVSRPADRRILHDVTTDESRIDARAELERVEREIAELRPQIRDIRERISDPADVRDRTEMLTLAEEQEAILAVLEERAEQLRQRLEH